MKLRATKKEVREGYYRIISIGYCDAQDLLKYARPFGYSAGYFGWCCDYYDINGVCISTGYSPLATKNASKDYKLVREYEELARNSDKDGVGALLNELVNKLTEGVN